MLTWLHEVNRLVTWVLGYPSGNVETLAVWSVALLALLVTMRCACLVFGISKVEWPGLIFSLLIGICCLLGARALTSMYVLQHIHGPLVRQIASFIIPVIAFLVIAIPVQCAVLKTTFVKCFLAFTASIIVAMAAIKITNAATGSLGAGERKSDSIRSRATNFEALLGD